MILDNKCQYAVPVYDFDNIQNVANENISFMINDQLFFEVLMMEIRGKTISYSTHKKKEEEKEEKSLIKEIKELEANNNLDQSRIPLLENKRERLKELRNKKLNGMIVRSRINWIQHGEKPSHYFCNLEKRNFINRSMCFLEKTDGELVFDKKEIVEMTKEFYGNLYNHREVNNVDLETVINNTPKLSEDEKISLEGPITYAEAHGALRCMKNNKSPGSDGFTCEFFKFFFQDIGDFLVRSLNYSFQNGQMSVTQKQGVITCIPKEGKPKHFLKNWRPISLLNTAYKIASACIANRIKLILPKLIHSDQKGFMKHRYIGENTHR